MSLLPDDTHYAHHSQVGTYGGKDLATAKIKLQVEEGSRGIGLIHVVAASECCNTPSRDPDDLLQDVDIVPH